MGLKHFVVELCVLELSTIQKLSIAKAWGKLK
jgi:hypothetical protein